MSFIQKLKPCTRLCFSERTQSGTRSLGFREVRRNLLKTNPNVSWTQEDQCGPQYIISMGIQTTGLGKGKKRQNRQTSEEIIHASTERAHFLVLHWGKPHKHEIYIRHQNPISWMLFINGTVFQQPRQPFS